MPCFLYFRQVPTWLILELHEMIRVSHAVACPMVFILICDLGRHRGLLKLMKNGQFEVFFVTVVRFLKILGKFFLITSSKQIIRLDRNRYGGGLVLHVNEQVPCKKLTNYENPIASEIIVLEFHQSKRKWLISGIYKAPNQKEAELLQNINCFFLFL